MLCFAKSGLQSLNRNIFVSCIYRAEPPKPKKKVDQATAKLREDRRRKRLERGIKKLQSYRRILKPVLELLPDKLIKKESELRKRPETNLSEIEIHRRNHIGKCWQQYLKCQRNLEATCIRECIHLQDEALDVLKSIDRRLYEDCLKKNETPISISLKGPFEYGPYDDYEPPQGDYEETTNIFEKGYKITVLDKKTVKEEMFEQLKQIQKKKK